MNFLTSFELGCTKVQNIFATQMQNVSNVHVIIKTIAFITFHNHS